jgi:hypothetical protein
MSYCAIGKTNIPYDLIFNYVLRPSNEDNVQFGDVVGNYICCNEGSSKYLFPIKFIDYLSSDRGDLVIEGFRKTVEKTVFHPLIGFEHDNDELKEEILDKDPAKEKVRITYNYFRT